jgi:hypothetical protein
MLTHLNNCRQRYPVLKFLRRLRQLANFLRHLNHLIDPHLMYLEIALYRHRLRL